MLARDQLMPPQPVDRPTLRGGHEPSARIVGHARLGPPLQRGDERVLGEFLGQPDVAQHAREAGDEPWRLDPPDRVDDAMGVGSRHGYQLKHPLLHWSRPATARGRSGVLRRGRCCLRSRCLPASAQQCAAERGGPGRESGADGEKRPWQPPVRAASESAPDAASSFVRAAARLASTASPSAPPIMKDVLTTPEAKPDSLGATSLIAASSTGLKAMPAPRPSRVMPGSTWAMKLPSTGDSAKSASPAAANRSPAASGSRMPKRITI